MDICPLEEVNVNSIDFVISLGGDGTILRLVHRHPEIQAPFLGINLGSLGFLADIPTNDITNSLQDLIDGKYQIQERMILEGMTKTGSFFAVNDIVVHRAQNPSLVDFDIYVDKEHLNTFSADGIIISTPGGSTAYSLSAGGPILTPDLEAIVLTPICPHTISNRPIVFMPKEEVIIKNINTSKPMKPLEVSFDGTKNTTLSPNEILFIRHSKFKFRLVNLLRPEYKYFTILRTKLGWTGKLRI